MRILFFSVLRDIVGTGHIDRDLPAEISVVGLLESLYEEWPDLKRWDGKLLIAADHEYVGRETTIGNSEEIAIMPPVQGG